MQQSMNNQWKNNAENHVEKSIEKWCQNDRKWEPGDVLKSIKNLKKVEKIDARKDVEKYKKTLKKNRRASEAQERTNRAGNIIRATQPTNKATYKKAKSWQAKQKTI